MSKQLELIKDWINESIALKKLLLEDGPLLEKVQTCAHKIVECFKMGGTFYTCGCGGADGGHLCAEFMNRFSLGRTVPLPAFDLSAMSHTLTAIANDYSFDFVFSKQLEAFGKGGDVLFAISTSGDSPSVMNAIRSAKQKEVYSILLTGNKKSTFYVGKKVKVIPDLVISFPSTSTPLLQESNLMLFHILCNLIDYNMVGVNYLDKSTW